jgi:hypothetical protein
MGPSPKVNLNQLSSLKEINLDDLITSFGAQDHRTFAWILRTLFQKPAQRFAEIMLDFDSTAAKYGLVEAARLTQRHFVRDVRVFGLDLIPPSGFLALSNHPGISDTLSIFCALNRPDLKIIALDRPFLQALPTISRQLCYLKEDPGSRVGLVRQVTAHLRGGGAALSFPAGHIEPDPDIYEGAVDSLQTWTSSAGVFLRMAPQTAILPILVRGVVWEKAATHILLKLKKTRDEKEKLAAALQLLAHVALNKKDVLVRVQIGHPIYAKDLGSVKTEVIHRAVLAEMKYLLENPPKGEGVSALAA